MKTFLLLALSACMVGCKANDMGHGFRKGISVQHYVEFVSSQPFSLCGGRFKWGGGKYDRWTADGVYRDQLEPYLGEYDCGDGSKQTLTIDLRKFRHRYCTTVLLSFSLDTATALYESCPYDKPWPGGKP